MTKEVQFRRGNSTAHSTFTGAAGEITINTDRNVPVVHDGTTSGGFEVVGLAATQTVTNKNLRVGTATSTGTASQPLQVVGGAYVSGNLGVGNTNPSFKFDVSGTARLGNGVSQGPLSSTDISVNAHTLLSGTGGNYLAFGQSNDFSQWIQSGFTNPTTASYNIFLNPLGGNVGVATTVVTGTSNQRLQVNSGAYISGNLGIGTTNPSTKLDVIGIGEFLANGATLNLIGTDHTYIQWYPDGVAAGRKAYTGFSGSSSNYFEIANEISDGTGHIYLNPGTNASVLIDSFTPTGTANQPLQVTGGASFVGTGASVGIGTTNPPDPLTISGRVQIQQLVDSSSRLVFRAKPGNLYRWNIDNDTTNLFRIFREDDITTANGIAVVHIRPEGNILIGTGTSTGTASQLLQVNSGAYFGNNVGIATTDPTAELHIVGPGTSTAGSAPIKVSAGSTFLLATPEQGAIEYDGTTLYATPNTSYGRAAVPLTLYTSGAGTAGITGSTNFALFPAANDTITLPIGTYLVRMRVRVAVTGSTVSSAFNINLRGAGNAVGSFSWGGTGSILDAGAASSFIVAATALGTNITVTAASAANPRQYIALGEGILKVTTGGTIIPSYQYGATLTSGTTTLVADNHMIIQSLDTQSVTAFGPRGSGWG